MVSDGNKVVEYIWYCNECHKENASIDTPVIITSVADKNVSRNQNKK